MVGFGVLGVGNNSLGQFTMPMAEAFGVARSVITFQGTLAKIAGSIAALIFGAVYRKVTVKGVVVCSGLALMFEYAMIAMSQSPIWAYIGCFVGGFGIQWAGGLFILTVIKPWFPKNVGIMAAICGTASGFGGSIFVTRVSARIVNESFRSAAWFVVILVAIFTAISAVLVFQSPEDPLRKMTKEMAAEAAAKKAAKKMGDPSVPALGYVDFLKLPTIWILMIMMFLASGTISPFANAYSAIAEWKGFADPIIVGGNAVAAFTAVLVWAKFIMGFLKDRSWMTFACILAWGTHIISIIGIMFCKTPETFVIMGGIDAFAGTSTQLLINFCLIQALGKYFNATATGLVAFTLNAGRAVGTPLVHLPYDLTGSYSITVWGMLITGIILLVGCLYALKFGKNTVATLDKRYGNQDAAVS